MRARFLPDFYKADRQNAQPAEPAASGAPLPLHYCARKYGSIDMFFRHRDFSNFQEQFTASIDHLVQFSREHAQAVRPPIGPETLAEIEDNFTTFKTRLFDQGQNFYSSHTATIFSTGKQYFDHLASLLAQDKVALEVRIGVIAELSKKTLVCQGGLFAALTEAIRTLTSNRSGIRGTVDRLKTTMAEATALAHVHRTHLYEPANEVHLVSAYLNHHADAFGITKCLDPFPPLTIGRPITRKNVKECGQALEQSLTPGRLVDSMASEYLGKIWSAVGDAGADPSVAIPGDKIQAVNNAVDSCQEHALSMQYGHIGKHDLFDLAADMEQYQLVKHPIRIARTMLDHLRDKKIVRYEDAVVLAREAPGGGDIMQLDNLFWRDTHGACEVLALKDLCACSPETIFETLDRCEGLTAAERLSSLQHVVSHVLENLGGDSREVMPEQWILQFASIAQRLPPAENKALATSLLILAATHDRFNALAALLEAGANPETRDGSGKTVLVLAAENGNVATVRTLQEAGADLDAASRNGQTALIAAAAKGHVDVVQALLAAGAAVDAAKSDGVTALMLAAENGHADVAQALLAARAAVDAATPREALIN